MRGICYECGEHAENSVTVYSDVGWVRVYLCDACAPRYWSKLNGVLVGDVVETTDESHNRR